MKPKKEPWSDKGEIAAHLSVSIRTVEREKYPSQLVGGQRRFKKSEVDAEIARRNGVGRLDTRDNVVPIRSKGAA